MNRGTIEERLARLESQAAADRQALRNLHNALSDGVRPVSPDVSHLQEKLDDFKCTLLEIQNLFLKEVEQLTNEFQAEVSAELNTLKIQPRQPAASPSPSIEPDVEEQSVLEGIRLAAREMSHLINNDITLAFGVFELLLNVEELGEQKLRLIRESQAGLYRAAARLRQFQQVQRVVTHETPSGRALDLEASQ